MIIIVIIISIVIPFYSAAQLQADTNQKITLGGCIQDALNNQPLFQQYAINEEITRRNIRAALSSWFPQFGMIFAQYNFILPVSLFPNLTTLYGAGNGYKIRHTQYFQCLI
jgi:outer membrane protein TolC